VSAVGVAVIAAVWRHRLQSAAIALVVLLASGVTTAAGTLLVAAGSPYDQVFVRLHGAHLTAVFDARRVTATRLRATAHLPAVAVAGGPWPATPVDFPVRIGRQAVVVQLVGRDAPGGAVEPLPLVAGRWPRAPGEIVLTRAFMQPQRTHGRLHLGDRLVAYDSPRTPSLVVVGEVVDVDEGRPDAWSPRRAWVRAAEIYALTTAEYPLQYVMAYRFHHAAPASTLQRDVAAVGASVPAGAVGVADTYLQVRDSYTYPVTFVLAVLVAASLCALVAAAMIIANVVTSVVLVRRNEIGILKALGCTPGQVVQVVAGQVLVPALAGVVCGVLFGSLSSAPLLARSASSDLPDPTVLQPGVDIPVLVGMLLLVAGVATLPTWRAGQLTAMDTLMQGPRARLQAPGLDVPRLLQTVAWPQPLLLSAADACARPSRSLLTILSILSGVATLTCAMGLHTTLTLLGSDAALTGGAYQVMITRAHTTSDQRLMGLLDAQPETVSVIAYAQPSLTIPGIVGAVDARAIRGDATRLGYQTVAGRWFQDSGEAVAGGAVMAQAHLRLGQTLTVRLDGRPQRLRIVGTIMDVLDAGLAVRFAWPTLAQVEPGSAPSTYLVQLRPPTDLAAYTRRVHATGADPRVDNVAYANTGAEAAAAATIGTLDGVLAFLVLGLALIGVAGTFNTLLVTGHDRSQETAVLKALGMTPRQVAATVTSSAGLLGLTGGLLGLPLGVLMHRSIVYVLAGLLGNATTIPGAFLDVFSLPTLAVLAASGMLIATLGAILPALWAARTSVAAALRTE
jgi:putative ABC transport system permease protein